VKNTRPIIGVSKVQMGSSLGWGLREEELGRSMSRGAGGGKKITPSWWSRRMANMLSYKVGVWLGPALDEHGAEGSCGKIRYENPRF